MKLNIYKVLVEHYIPSINHAEEWYVASNAEENEISKRESKGKGAKSIQVSRVGTLEMELIDLIPSQCNHGDIKVWIKDFCDMVEYKPEDSEDPYSCRVLAPK